MNTTTLTPMLGRVLTDDELSAFHGGQNSCTITVQRVSNDTTVTAKGNCDGIQINVVVAA